MRVSSPVALSDAKSLLTSPKCPVTFSNSRVWGWPFPPRLVSPASKDFTSHSQTGSSSPPLQRPHLHYKTNKNKTRYSSVAPLHCFVSLRMQKGPMSCSALRGSLGLSAWAVWLAKPWGQCSASHTAGAYLYAFIPNCIWVSSSKTARRKAPLVYCHCVGTANGTQPSAKLKSGYVANQDKITFLLTNCVKLPSSANLESLLVSGEFTSHIPWSI